MNIQPLANRILVRPAEAVNKIGRLFIPDNAQKPCQEGTVEAIGTGDKIEVKLNDRVLFAKYGGTDVELEGKPFKIISQDDILAVIN